MSMLETSFGRKLAMNALLRFNHELNMLREVKGTLSDEKNEQIEKRIFQVESEISDLELLLRE